MSATERRMQARMAQVKYHRENRAAVKKRFEVGQMRASGGLDGLFEEYLGLCGYCSKRLPDGRGRQIDHFTPLSMNGDNNRTNLVPCCVGCNSSKSDKTFIVWLATRPRNSAEKYLMRFAR